MDWYQCPKAPTCSSCADPCPGKPPCQWWQRSSRPERWRWPGSSDVETGQKVCPTRHDNGAWSWTTCQCNTQLECKLRYTTLDQEVASSNLWSGSNVLWLTHTYSLCLCFISGSSPAASKHQKLFFVKQTPVYCFKQDSFTKNNSVVFV